MDVLCIIRAFERFVTYPLSVEFPYVMNTSIHTADRYSRYMGYANTVCCDAIAVQMYGQKEKMWKNARH